MTEAFGQQMDMFFMEKEVQEQLVDAAFVYFLRCIKPCIRLSVSQELKKTTSTVRLAYIDALPWHYYGTMGN